MLTLEKKSELYNCILKQFPDPGLYKMSRISEWLYTNGLAPNSLGYADFRGFANDFGEMFAFQSDNNDEFIEIKKWNRGEEYKTEDTDSERHPADSFFGTYDIILNDDIIEMTQQSLYALSKILDNGNTVTMMKQEIYEKFEEAKKNGKLKFLGDKYVFPIDCAPDGCAVNGVVTKNLSLHGKSLYFLFEKTQINCEVNGEKKSHRVHKSVPIEDKNRIYMLLTDNFSCDQPIHMASISKWLQKSGIDRNKYGFYKMKELLASLDFLILNDVVMGGVPQTTVTIKRIPGYSSEENPRIKTEEIPGENIPEGCFSDFCGLPGKPMSILEQYLREKGINASYDSITSDLNEDFEKCRREGTIRTFNTKLIFTSRYQKSDGTLVEITIKPNSYDGKPWFLYFVDTTVHEKSTYISPGKQLESFAFLGNWATFLSDLANKAIDEEWDFKDSRTHNHYILMQYMKYTFSRLMRENKVMISKDRSFAAFNTGLADEHYDDIYACFAANENDSGAPWRYSGFCTAASGGLGKQLVDCFNPLPEPPCYFRRKEDLLYNTDNQLHTDFDHIIIDNVKRLPLRFLSDQFFDNQAAAGIVRKISETSDRFVRADLYDSLKKIIKDSHKLFMRIQDKLKCSIELALKRVRWNYKTAVPSYYPKRDSMSLMLPLALADESKPDVALVVELTRSGSYQGQTILTLPQAYIDARLVCRLTGDWLVTSMIVGDDTPISEELPEAE